MVKEDIIDIIHKKVGFTYSKAVDTVEFVFEMIKDRLMAGEDVNIVGFGKFCLRDKKERLGRNPKTGEEFKITARRVLTFKPSKNLKEIVNSKI
jgi:integration host factor subunit alpha